ncbi:MAG: hypothetical protein GX159_09830 [Flavobacteriaceae bacterium]|jgi:hypothetical protein|nr:hypothetical protein [Flavobacteriaceae bacterium]
MSYSAESSRSNSWFDLNVDKLVILLLRTYLRFPKRIAYLQTLAKPLKRIHYEWKINRLKNLYRISHNWMKCYMESALNDEFDPQLRRITIDEPDIHLNKYIYTQSENKPKFLGTMYLRTSAELDGSGMDFTVNFNGASGNIYDIRALVDFYKMAGPRYNIINLAGALNQNQTP